MVAITIGKKARTMSLSNKAAMRSTANCVRLSSVAACDSESATPSSVSFGFGSLLRRGRTCNRGAAAAEFALVLPVMMMMLMGTFEYGIAFFTYSSMQNAARDVGRQVAINTMMVNTAEGAIRARLPEWARDGANVSIQQSAPANPNTNVYTFVVSMPMSSATPIQFVSLATNPTLRTELRMKQELPYVNNP